MNKLLKTGIVIILISILIAIGLAIWLGFPCEGYNRTPIIAVGYVVVALGLMAGMMCTIGGGVDGDY